MLSKFNEELLKQSSNLLSEDELNKSKEFAENLKINVNNLTSKINSAQEQSLSLDLEIKNINTELVNAIGVKSDLEKNIIDLNNQLSVNKNIFSKKELELDSLKNADLDSKLNDLNSKITQVSREKDFIESNFEKSIDLEVEALKRYHTALGNIDSKDYDKDIDFSLREIGVLMDPDPRKHRSFEIEKYATYAGFSDDYINKSIQKIQMSLKNVKIQSWKI